MKRNKFVWTAFLLLTLITVHTVQARDFIIYSIGLEVPMGTEGEKLQKNYYINMGTNQGVKQGTRLDVVRTIAKQNPYDSNKRYTHQVKVGELVVLHTEEENAITHMEKFKKDNPNVLFEINDFMIGDSVQIHVKK